MLIGLCTGTRFRLAVTLAALAAVCFTLPPALLAMGHGADTVGCLSHAGSPAHEMAAAKQAGHAGGHQADHAGGHHPAHAGTAPHDEHQPAHDMTCCGVFCLGAILAFAGTTTGEPVPGLRTRIATPRLIFQSPIRPERPPNTALVA